MCGFEFWVVGGDEEWSGKLVRPSLFLFYIFIFVELEEGVCACVFIKYKSDVCVFVCFVSVLLLLKNIV